MTKWFRMYDEALDDPKVQRLPAEDFKFWVNCLMLANRHGGVLPSISDIAFAFRMEEIAVVSVIDRLLIAGLIDQVKGGANGKRIAPHGWEKRQYKSDTSTDRVKRFRERFETVPETPRGRSESDTDSEAEKERLTNVNPKKNYGPDFAQWWLAYPEKVSKGAAETAYAKARGVATAEELLAGVRRYIASKPPDRSWAHAATWLNNKRWLDEPAPVKGRGDSLFAGYNPSDDPRETFR